MTTMVVSASEDGTSWNTDSIHIPYIEKAESPCPNPQKLPDDLFDLIASWDRLPNHIKEAVMATVHDYFLEIPL